jgi:hypothetical protein
MIFAPELMNLVRLSIAVSILCALAAFTAGQALEEKLAVRVERFDSESKSVPLQLIEVAQSFNIPMGIEWADDSQPAAVAVHLRDTTVRQVLEQILTQQPGYEFRLEDGVVHVFAGHLVDDPHNFLNIRLRKFSVEKANMAAARYYLWSAIFSHLHPQRGYGGGWGGESRYKDFNRPKITFRCQDLTVRQALSKIVGAEGNALWFVRIRQREMMKGEAFYAQIPGPEDAEPAESFAWEFIALDVHREQ